jgi:hypothetical protein
MPWAWSGLETLPVSGQSKRRAGISGTLQVDKDRFNLDAELGFVFASFKERIETQIAKNLDDLLAA